MSFFYFRYKLYSNLQKMPCELLEFSLSTRHSFSLGSCFISVFPESRLRSCRLPVVSSELLQPRPSSLLHEPSWLPVYLIPFQLFPYTLESISFKEKSSLFLHTIRNLCGDLILCGLNLYDRIIISKSSCCDNEVPEFPSI